MSRNAFVLLVIVPLACGCGGGGGGGGGPTPSEPDRFFVRATAGDDANDGTSATSALRTIGAALARLTDGDTVIVGPGVYNEAIVDPRSGIAGQPIVLQADASGTMTGDAPGAVVVDATGADPPVPGVRLSTAQFVEIDGFTIQGGATAGVQVRIDSQNVTIRNCEILDNSGDGVLIQDSSAILLFNNLIHDNDRRGIALAGAPNVKIINNTVALNGDRGIFLTSRNNAASSGAFVRNNIVQDNSGVAVQVVTDAPSSLDRFDYQNNLVFPPRYQPTDLPHPTDTNEDALLIDAPGGNFRLAQVDAGQAQTSPAVDRGVKQDAGEPRANFTALNARTTSTNPQLLDADPIDLGHHFLPQNVAAGGNTIFVRTAGNDDNSGASAGEALRTISAAARDAEPGDRIVVGPGVYNEAVIDPPSGTASQAIVLFADSTGQITGDSPGDVVVDASGEATGIRLSAAAFVTVDGFVVRGARSSGIQVRSGSRNVVIRNCEASANDDGIRVDDSTDVLVFNNLAVENPRRGILISNSTRTRIINNTVANNEDRGIVVGTGTNVNTDTLLQNNVVQENPGRNVQANDESVATLTLRFNLVFPESYFPTSIEHATDANLSARFVEQRDYHLDQVESPAVDAGDPETDTILVQSLQMRSTAADGSRDASPIDLGFHFPSP